MDSINSIHINLNVSKAGINQFIHEYMEQFSLNKIETDNYEITLKKSENVLFDVHASETSRAISLDIPMDFTFYKKAGLFSVEGEGGITASVEIHYDIHPDLSISTKSTLLNYQWTQKPKVHLGTLNIPVETLSDCIIHFMKERVLSMLDQAISEKIDLKSLIHDQWQQYASNFILHLNPKMYFNAALNNIISQYLKSDQTHLNLELFFDLDISITDRPLDILPEFNPVFSWKQGDSQAHHLYARGSFSYKSLSKMLISAFNEMEIGGKKVLIDSILISKRNQIEIKANITAPIEGIITLTCTPDIDVETQKVDLKYLDIQVSAGNIIYRMASPMIEKTIIKKIQESLPFDLGQIMDTYTKKIPAIRVFDNRIALIPKLHKTSIESIEFHDDLLEMLIRINNMEVDVDVTG